ncbi:MULTISPECIES: hypothetical protein [unclassified Rhizobium]|uniref:hypothetical protein n=1 Tax=unclassified Rhizobium TaxID=2613769 RepID=UPI000EA87526|nr:MULTISPECIES: hypothetical protein [unclassified Rhizobium]AYG69028.1 hypothetical protein CCGE531_23485 [Rhizobium sp. CCGE531]AYG75406.1 hypothetical protein CCGE532_22975 [Rhizobium sp. CCGE532]
MLSINPWRREELSHIVVTTFHEKGYRDYGKRCIETFLACWPKDISLVVYAENVEIEEKDRRLLVFDHLEALPRLRDFRKAYGNNPQANGFRPSRKWLARDFRWDAVRFSNKVFAVADAVRRYHNMVDQLIWLDADTITHRDIPKSFLDGIAPRGDQLAAYLNRRIYPECGWVGYNLRHREILTFAERFEGAYSSGYFLTMKESHDSFVFWKVLQQMESDKEASFKRLGSSLTKTHVFINSVLGGYLDHLKGDRKSAGRSRRSDLKWGRREAWWR